MAARKQRSRRGQRSPRGAPGAPWWLSLSEQELLGVRLCELGLGIEGTALESRIEQLMGELARAGLCFQPSIWLSTDWFSPSGVPGFALPFYLAHPRLARLEGTQMFEVEGGNRDWCMNLLRHEAGHAIDTAYRLRRKKGWRECFGSPAESYYTTYTPRPTSRYFVHNLDNWYAQSHPIEDFAEPSSRRAAARTWSSCSRSSPRCSSRPLTGRPASGFLSTSSTTEARSHSRVRCRTILPGPTPRGRAASASGRRPAQ